MLDLFEIATTFPIGNGSFTGSNFHSEVVCIVINDGIVKQPASFGARPEPVIGSAQCGLDRWGIACIRVANQFGRRFDVLLDAVESTCDRGSKR